MKEKTQVSPAGSDRDYIRTGLSARQVEQQIKAGNINGNFTIKTKSIGQILSSNIFTLFNFVNLFLALCVIYVHSYKNVLFLVVVFWNIFIGSFQEIRSKRVMDKLSLLSTPNAQVIRDGEKKLIPLSEIVKDDLMILSAGDQI